MSTIEVPTRWGAIAASYDYRKHPTGSSKLAVLFPGRNYPMAAPLMWYSAMAAFEAECDVIGVEYGYMANRAELEIGDMEYLVDEAVGALENVVTAQYSQVVFVGKSIGTIVQNEVAQSVSFPVRNRVFLTPLRQVIPAIRQTHNALVVVGDRDSAFGPSDITQVTEIPRVQLQVMPGADHGLETGDFKESVDVLKRTATLCGDFCKHLL